MPRRPHRFGCGSGMAIGLLAAVARRHESTSGRRLVLLTRISDRPGGLGGLEDAGL